MSAPGFVYFIVCRDADRIKIGYAKNPRARLRSLQSMCPLPLELLLSVEGTPALERQFHTFFFDVHVRDEWFRFSPVVRRIIDDLIAGEFDHALLPKKATRAWALARRAESAAA